MCRVGLEADYWDGGQAIVPFVTTSVLWSLYSFLRAPDDYWGFLDTFKYDSERVVLDKYTIVHDVEELIGASFQIRNPQATSSCGCGSSFAV